MCTLVVIKALKGYFLFSMFFQKVSDGDFFLQNEDFKCEKSMFFDNVVFCEILKIFEIEAKQFACTKTRSGFMQVSLKSEKNILTREIFFLTILFHCSLKIVGDEFFIQKLCCKSFKVNKNLFFKAFGISLSDFKNSKESEIISELEKKFRGIFLDFEDFKELLFNKNKTKAKFRMSQSAEKILSKMEENYIIFLDEGIKALI